MAALPERRIWLTAVVANVTVLGAALLAGVFGAKSGDIIGALTIFIYLETFVAILWYTIETRRMQESVTQQAKLIANSLRGTLYDSMRNSMMQINQLFIASPHLRPYFYDGASFTRGPKDEANTKLYHELSSIADCLLDIFEGVTHNMREFPDKVPEYVEAWDNYIGSVFETSPFLNAHLDRHPNWYVGLQKYRKR